MLWWQVRKLKPTNEPSVRIQAALSINSDLAKSFAKSSVLTSNTQLEAINGLIESIQDPDEAVRLAAIKALDHLGEAMPVAPGCQEAAGTKRIALGGAAFFLKAHRESILQSGGKAGVDILITETTLRSI